MRATQNLHFIMVLHAVAAHGVNRVAIVFALQLLETVGLEIRDKLH